jgi:squalene-associated FAD-dependent desaturase
MPERRRVVVVGGGIAGLATAVWLSERGVAVTLVEERGRLGGRTIGIDVEKAGATVDNGQHAMLPSYSRLREYLETIGSLEKMTWMSTWVQRDAERGPVRMTPLAILRSGAIPLRDIPALAASGARFLAALVRLPASLDRLSVDEWLRAIRMPASARTLFFDPFVTALNDTPDRFSAFTMIQTLRTILVRSVRDPRKLGLGYSTVDLSSLLVAPAVALLEARGCAVLPRSGVHAVRIVEGRCVGVTLADGTETDADAVVLAIPPWALARLAAGGSLGHEAFFGSAREIEAAPIVSTYVWLDRPLEMVHAFEGLLGTTAEWIFDRTVVHGERDALGYGYSLVTSAAYRLQELSKAEVVEAVLASMRTQFPEFADRTVLHTHVVRQPQATFSPRPGFQRLRRPQTTPVARLVLAGDWTETGLSSLMEGAAESARRAADEVLRQLA